MRHAPVSAALLAAVLAALLAALAVACGRELEVPPPPVAAEEGPAFLGELSGFYRLSIAVAADGRFQQLPLGATLAVVHLDAPAPGVPDPVFAFLPDGLPQLPSFFYGSFDGETLSVVGEEGAMELARRVPGGGALAFTQQLPLCEGGPRYELRALRVCPFDPSLSGIYEGTRGDCTGGPRSRVSLALGVSGTIAVGSFYPDSGRLLVVEQFDRFHPAGEAVTMDIAQIARGNEEAPAEPLDFALVEEAGSLHFSFDSFEVDPRTGAIGGCKERYELSRLAGGELTDCTPELVGGGRLDLQIAGSELGGSRFLAVLASPAASPATILTFDDGCLELTLRDAATGRPIEPVGVELPDLPEVTAVYPLGDPGEATPDRYELFARRSCGGPEVTLEAPPACVLDAGSYVELR